MCSARLRLAMHGCRRVRHVYGSPCTVADVFGTSSESLRTLDEVVSTFLNPDAPHFVPIHILRRCPLNIS
ncbi:unnamed protein product [Heligmosomoides polygyrus]|uniref:Uncharacterized protein n=1 Tax=Heligmosomoides polygyrus TaxID=6339 RepID=A0A183GGI2_HELPZ|nr:unnamed protein product [Heligmosomoides polygyrus]